MTDASAKIMAVLGFIIGAILTYFGYYLVSALAGLLPITALKTFFWIGLISYWLCAMLVVPLMMISRGVGSWKGAFYGFLTFFLGYLVSLLTYYVGGSILTSMNGIYPNSNFLGIMWFGIYVIWGLGLIIVPTYLTVKDSVIK